MGRSSQGTPAAAHVAATSSTDSQPERGPDLKRDRRQRPRLTIYRDADTPAQMNQFDQWLTATATWSAYAEEYWVNTVRVSREAYTKLARMTPAERAACGGSSASVLGLRMPDDVQLLEKILRAELSTALPNYVPPEARHKNFANEVKLVTTRRQSSYIGLRVQRRSRKSEGEDYRLRYLKRCSRRIPHPTGHGVSVCRAPSS